MRSGVLREPARQTPGALRCMCLVSNHGTEERPRHQESQDAILAHARGPFPLPPLVWGGKIDDGELRGVPGLRARRGARVRDKGEEEEEEEEECRVRGAC